MAVPLLGIVKSPNRLIADKAYDADSLRNWLKIRRIKAVIPSTASRTVAYPLDRAVYRRRNLIERLFCRLKNWRRLATRYVPTISLSRSLSHPVAMSRPISKAPLYQKYLLLFISDALNMVYTRKR